MFTLTAGGYFYLFHGTTLRESHPEKMAADHFSALRSRTAVEENQNSFPSTEEAGQTEWDSEVVLACRAEGRESSSV